MSFGRPNSTLSFGAKPPDRGSFPLDHDGECKEYMKRYLNCMKTAKSQSTDCRQLSKEYLGCRMDKGLMERVSWEDLGFQDGVDATAKTKPGHERPPTGDKLDDERRV
ncbi:hypothetical protein T439DRAFT_326240 [Meredithblackwellia eburnea MCA 4105]